MKIRLQEIDESNLGDCESLKRESNRYVGGPLWVIANAYVHRKNSVAYAIYNDDIMVGMVILIDQGIKHRYSFADLFIADNYQNLGFATGAANCIIEKFKFESKYSNITIFVHESNTIALHIYEKVGFKITGNAEWDNCFYVLELNINR